jgi:hypothetical protein
MASGNDEWQTPPELFEPALKLVLASTGQDFFDVDPFPGKKAPLPARKKLEDGFNPLLWPDSGTVFVNGPWSIQKRVVELCVHVALSGVEIILVQPVTGAQYLPYILRAPARCYPYRRPQFLRKGKRVASSNRTDVVLVYWGVRPWAFQEVYRDLGVVDR